MPLINCEINYILHYLANCVIFNLATSAGATLAITDTRLYVPLLTLSNQDKAKLWKQLKLCVKRTDNWNKYQKSVLSARAQNQYLNYLIGPGFLEVLFVLPFEISADRTSQARYLFPKVEINDYNVMVDGGKLYYQPKKDDNKTFKILGRLLPVKEMIE